MDSHQQFCLKWNSYSSNLATTFSNLFKSDLLADVTLSCDGRVFKAHKLILAACSKKFADLFESTPTTGQCVVILEATSSENMAALLEFMYKGEVHVAQEALNGFLKSAENLQVKGLSTETGRLAAQQAQEHLESPSIGSPDCHDMRGSMGDIGNSCASNMSNNLSVGNGNGNANSNGNGNGNSNGNGNGNGNISGNGNGNSTPGSINNTAANVGINNLGLVEHCSGNGGGIINDPTACLVGGNIVGGVAVGLGNDMNSPHNLSGSSASLKQECETLMHPSSSIMSNMSTYVPPIYRPISYEPLRKRALRSPYAEQEIRGSVLRDGSKNSSDCISPINKPPYHRPSSSGSLMTPTEVDAMHCDRVSPQSCRYENQSPNTMGSGILSAPNSIDRLVKPERINCPTKDASIGEEEDIDDDLEDSCENCAEDLRVKLENSNYTPPTNETSTTPTTLMDTLKNADNSLSSNLASSIAPADMLNVWNATKLNNKNRGMVNTADGKKLKCLYCDRLYGYETNLRAHIRQRHQGIRVHCPFCSRTFTRNNTVRRHIAREHKQEIGVDAGNTIAVVAAAAAAANHTQ